MCRVSRRGLPVSVDLEGESPAEVALWLPQISSYNM